MMGSRGPKISSVMIAESSGGFSSIVGSMDLLKFFFDEDGDEEN